MKKWTERSLSSWLSLGMVLAVAPVLIGSVIVHAVLDRTALEAYEDTAARYRAQLVPLQHLRADLWEAGVPVEESLDAREPLQQTTYRELRIDIETRFSRVRHGLARDPEALRLVDRAQSEWSDADRIAGALLAHPRAHGDPSDIEAADRFAGIIRSAADHLSAAVNIIDADVEADHASATRAHERATWVTGIAAGVSLLAIIAGVLIIVRVMLANIARLVEGARRFAAGDRDHRIAVSVPPELRDVADEFNRMIVRIREAEQALAEQARHDTLTGLPNRRAFDEALAAAFARIRRLDEAVALLSFDIDHFKKVNDTHGHAGGDAALRVVGAVLAKTIREVDRAFRVGGEEFAVILTATDLAGAAIAAERIRTSIAETPIALDGGGTLHVTVSIGVAQAATTQSADDLVRAADEALYAAKAGGRNRVVAAKRSTS